MKTKLSLLFGILLLTSLQNCSKSISLNYPGNFAVKENGDTLYYHIGRKPSGNLSDKLLVILQGSEQYSVRRLFGYGAEASMFGYDILLINKYAFYDSVRYWKTNSFSRRIDDVCFVIDHVRNTFYNGKLKKIILLGGSEGGVIAPFVARNIPQVNQMIIMSAGALTQAREFEILFDKIPDERNYFLQSGIKSLDDLKSKLDEIRRSSDSSNFWMGYSYKYWKSYIDTSYTDAILGLPIPVLVISGTMDEMMPVESVRELKTSADGRENIRIEIINGADHRFVNKQGKSIMPYVYKEIIMPWLGETGAL